MVRNFLHEALQTELIDEHITLQGVTSERLENKAIYFNQVWLPLSYTEITDLEEDGSCHIRLPKWLAEMKGLLK